MISETTASINQFCQNVNNNVDIDSKCYQFKQNVDDKKSIDVTKHPLNISKEDESNDVTDNISHTKDIVTKDILNINVTNNNITSITNKENSYQNAANIVKSESNPFTKAEAILKPSNKVQFEEVLRSRSGSRDSEKRVDFPDNKPFLRDRSASIGTINNKTPIAQLIGEQNRTMLFQVMNYTTL